MSVRQFFSALSIGVIGVTSTFPGAIAQAIPPSSNPRSGSNGDLTMVMVDQSRLSSTQRKVFQQYLQTANLPRTKVGNRCQFYGKPNVWCLLLDHPLAQQVYNQLRKQREFGAATTIKEVRRLNAPERS